MSREIRQANLVATYHAFAGPPAFLLPLVNHKDGYATQTINRGGVIGGFETVFLDDDEDVRTLDVQFRRKLRIGDLPVYAFALSDDEIFIGSSIELAIVLKPQLERLGAYPNLLIEVVQFIAMAEQSVTLTLDSITTVPKTQTRKSQHVKKPLNSKDALHKVRALMRRIAPAVAKGIARKKFLEDLSIFKENLGPAIIEITKHQRRTQLDVLSDLGWALENDTQDLRQLATYQVAAAKSGRVKEMWVATPMPLDIIPSFFKSTAEMLLKGVNIRYFVDKEDHLRQIGEKVMSNGTDHPKGTTDVRPKGATGNAVFRPQTG